MSDSNAETPEDFAGQIRNALLKGFIIPVAVLIFFAAAPAWLNHNLHESVAQAIDRSEASASEKAQRHEAYARVDFAEVCGANREGLDQLRANLEENDLCGQFHRLQWGLWLSVLLVAIMTGSVLATFFLNRRARRSPADLIAAYRSAWRVSIAAAVAKTLLLIPLLAYGTFELTTLAFERFLPKLILLIVVGGLIALWRSISTLLKEVPLEFAAPMARAVTAADARRLWDDIRAAALRLGTTAPDHVLIGMENNFYVTELAVNHGGGRATGRTLYLSLPLMQQLTPGEVLAIIGHELGHFRGADTAITREFYPLRLKASATLTAMAEAGWVGWSSLHSLLFFHGSFAQTEQAMSRERELLADRVAAELTSPVIMASALTKIHVFGEAFLRTLKGGAANPFTVPLTSYVRSQLVGETEFWRGLFEQKAPHPLDSHPALRVRLAALGQPVDPEHAKAVATTEGDTAYAHWLAGRDELFAGIQAEALEGIGRVRAASADYATAEGKQLLDQHFPEVRWKIRTSGLWVRIAACGLGVAVSLLLLFVLEGVGLKLMMVGFALICAYPMVLQWRRHRGGEFVLRADGLSYTGWLRPLVFADVTTISTRSEYGSITLTFHLHTKQAGRWRYSPFNWIHTRTVEFALGLIPGKQQATLETIVRYFTRQVGP